MKTKLFRPGGTRRNWLLSPRAPISKPFAGHFQIPNFWKEVNWLQAAATFDYLHKFPIVPLSKLQFRNLIRRLQLILRLTAPIFLVAWNVKCRWQLYDVCLKYSNGMYISPGRGIPCTEGFCMSGIAIFFFALKWLEFEEKKTLSRQFNLCVSSCTIKRGLVMLRYHACAGASIMYVKSCCWSKDFKSDAPFD